MSDSLNSYSFSNKWFENNKDVFEQFLSKFSSQDDINFLEIGVFEGQCTCWLLDNILIKPKSNITCIDPFFKKGTKSRFLKNIELTNKAPKVRLLEGLSSEHLKNLKLNSFDFIYIDGAHKAPYVLEDAVLSWRLLKKGGIIIFDDYLWNDPTFSTSELDQPKIGIDSFLQAFENRYKILYSAYIVVIEKIVD